MPLTSFDADPKAVNGVDLAAETLSAPSGLKATSVTPEAPGITAQPMVRLLLTNPRTGGGLQQFCIRS